ncbi:hypothetical protein BS17DRAFT_769695 [Gyrodon lividus]|nr:hypothetical protein BS17DRAFT_769695 [Gyrodon lividus]
MHPAYQPAALQETGIDPPTMHLWYSHVIQLWGVGYCQRAHYETPKKKKKKKKEKKEKKEKEKKAEQSFFYVRRSCALSLLEASMLTNDWKGRRRSSIISRKRGSGKDWVFSSRTI